MKQKDEHSQTDEICRMVDGAAEADVRDFLTQLLWEDEKLAARFRNRISHTISGEEMNRYKERVDAVVREYLGREGFISYREANSFVREMEELLDTDVQMFLDDGDYREAFALTCHMFGKVGSVEIDDSDGGIGILMERCADILEEILEEADAQVEREIYEWLTRYLDSADSERMEEYLERVLMHAFTDREYVKDKLMYTQRRAQEQRANADSWSAGYQAQKWALYHIELMEEEGYGTQTIFSYCKEHWAYAQVREYYIETCMEIKDYDAAIAALQESLQMDAGAPGLVRKFAGRLKEAYRVSGRQEDYKQQLWQLVTKEHAGNLEDFRELKGLYEEEEWKRVREKIFQTLPAYAQVERLYEEEALYDRLLAYVLQEKGLYAVRKYQSVLEKEYPKQILQKYAEELNEMAGCAADRRRYQEWTADLRRMTGIPGGQEKVQEIVANWRVRYKNRPAMLEELKRLDI